jgi:hypothetical protein
VPTSSASRANRATLGGRSSNCSSTARASRWCHPGHTSMRGTRDAAAYRIAQFLQKEARQKEAR